MCPVGPHNLPLPGMLVVYLHYPAQFFAAVVLRIDGLAPGKLGLWAALMIPVWVALLFALEWFLRKVRAVGKEREAGMMPPSASAQPSDGSGRGDAE